MYGAEEKVCDIPVQLSSSLEGQITSRLDSNFDLHYLNYISLNFLNISSHYKKRIQINIIYYLLFSSEAFNEYFRTCQNQFYENKWMGNRNTAH